MGLILAFTGLVRADELTVNDGTTTNQYIPLYGYYADMAYSYNDVQFILPSGDLTAMVGANITDLMFYANYNQNFGSAEWSIYIEETTSTTLSEIVAPTSSPVYTGHLAVASNQLAISLTSPYFYNGDNLLVSFIKASVSGTCSSSSADRFYGVTAADGASAYRNNGYFYKEAFLPKVTFTYEGGSPAPQRGLHVVDAEGTIDAINMGPRPSGAWMRPYEFTMTYDGAQPIAPTATTMALTLKRTPSFWLANSKTPSTSTSIGRMWNQASTSGASASSMPATVAK